MTRSPFDLVGKVALVTGASGGIGEAIAIALAQAGADVVAVGRSEPSCAAARVSALGRAFHAISTDLSLPGNSEAVVAQAFATAGHVDILVNNAGTIRRADSLDFTEADWDVVMDTNLKSAFFLSQAVARRWVAAGQTGKIINIVSLLSFQGGIRVASYTASKSGLAGLTKLLCNEWGPLGINVNAVAPGYIESSVTEALRADGLRSRQILDRIPAGRWGRPEDVGGAVTFLASEAAHYIHGAILPVDGGWLAR